MTGWNLIQAGDLAGAREHFRGLTQAEPSFAQAWYLLGSVNQLLGNITESLANYERVLELEPNHVATLNNLGVALQSLGMAEEAAASLRIAIRNKPDYAEAHSNLGNALKDQGDLEGAVACYRRAIEIDPELFRCVQQPGKRLARPGTPGRIGDVLRKGARAEAGQSADALEPCPGVAADGRLRARMARIRMAAEMQ